MTRFAFDDLLDPVVSADEPVPGPARKVLSALAWIFSWSVFLFSSYIIWGWITTSDVKRFCEQNKISYEEMASAFVSGRKIVIDTNQVITVIPRKAAPVDRLSFVAQLFAVSYGTNSPSGGREITMLDVSPLMPFLQMSENFLNFVYCFALGCFISFVVMLVRIYTGVEQVVRVVAWRPLLGGLCAACLYVLSIAATDLLLEQRGDFRFGSLPAMALIGALSVERFERMLRSLDRR